MAQTASFREAAAVAADSLRSSKLRSFLTLLGIILATTTLIAVMSMIHGMDVYIANTVSNMGSDGFRIVKIAVLGNFDPKKFLEMQKRNPELNPDEFQYLKDHVSRVNDLGMGANRFATVSGWYFRGDQQTEEPHRIPSHFICSVWHRNAPAHLSAGNREVTQSLSQHAQDFVPP